VISGTQLTFGMILVKNSILFVQVSVEGGNTGKEGEINRFSLNFTCPKAVNIWKA